MHSRAAGCDGEQHDEAGEEQSKRVAAHIPSEYVCGRWIAGFTIEHTAMKNALLLFLLSFAGVPQPPDPAVIEPAASIRTEVDATAPGIGAVEEILGAWRGRWQTPEGAATPVDVVFTPGIRPRTVFAYVTLVEGAAERTLRRPGRLTDDGLEFTVPGRGVVLLRAKGVLLVAPGLTLNRLRQ